MQDESTAIRTEQLRALGTGDNKSLYRTGVAAPVFTPRRIPNRGESRPVAVMDLLRPVYANRTFMTDKQLERIGTAPTRSAGEMLYSADLYRSTGLAAIVERHAPLAVHASYRRRGAREDESKAFDFEIQLRRGVGAFGEVQTVVDADLNPFLEPLIRWLDFAADELDTDDFDVLVATTERLLGTDGYDKGVVLGWLDLCKGVLELLGGDLPSGDDLTAAVTDILDQSQLGLLLDALVIPLKRAATDYSKLVAANRDIGRAYEAFLEANPELAGDAAGALGSLRQEINGARRALPSTYPLMMTTVQDPLTFVNICGYDFPHGPGRSNLEEDVFLADYQLIEGLRAKLAIELATTHLPIISSYLGGDDTAPEDRRANRDDFENVYNAAVTNIQSQIKESRRGTDSDEMVPEIGAFAADLSFLDSPEIGIFCSGLPLLASNSLCQALCAWSCRREVFRFVRTTRGRNTRGRTAHFCHETPQFTVCAPF